LASISHQITLQEEKEWLLGLKSDGEILGGGDKKIPKGCDKVSGHSLDSFFTKSLQRYAYYNDTEGFPIVKAHLDKLKEEVASRPLVDTIKEAAVSRRSIKANDDDNEEEQLADKNTHAEEDLTLKIKAALESKESQIKALQAKVKAALESKDSQIKVLRAKVEANEKLIAELKAISQLST
jgi:hypothetical protein